MLYLEDYLEKLEYLPEEIRNYTSKIGQLDQQVKDSMGCIKENVDNLFSNADTMHPDNLDADFKIIMKFGDKVLKTSDEKIELANKMHNLIKKYMSHIDIEIEKFKLDLNINRSGTTELIEKHVDELFNNDSSFNDEFIVVDSNSPNNHDLASYLQVDTIPTDLNQSPLSDTLKNMNDSSSISAATPKVMVSPKKSVKRRKSASLKASFEAINCKKMNAELDALSLKLHINKELPQLDSSNKSQTKKRLKNFKQKKTNNTLDMSIDEDNIEPNDRRYCLCNEVAYSTMIACDNSKCPHEWFHYECVGIKSEPNGKWFCPKCIIKLKKRRRR